MTPRKLAMLWLNGDLPFRPREISEIFVLRIALRDPVKAAGIVAELNDGSRALSCGPAFVVALAQYRHNPNAWLYHRRQECERQRAINECRRGRQMGRLVA